HCLRRGQGRRDPAGDVVGRAGPGSRGGRAGPSADAVPARPRRRGPGARPAPPPPPAARRYSVWISARMTRPGPDRAVTEEPRARAGRDHLVVCGDDALASRMVEELTLRYGEEVTVILPSAERGQGPRIAQLPGVRLIERAELDHEAFLAAEVPSA